LTALDLVPARHCTIIRLDDSNDNTASRARKKFDVRKRCDFIRFFCDSDLRVDDAIVARASHFSHSSPSTKIAPRTRQTACEKNFRPGAPKCTSRHRIRHESSESAGSDSFSWCPSSAMLTLMKGGGRPLGHGLCVQDARAAVTKFQMPSLRLSRSFTACGLTLPPDAFIACPTNQPMSLGLATAC